MPKKITVSTPPGEPDEPRRGQKALAASIPPYVWLTPQQMEDRYGLSKSYWYNHREDGTGPPFVPMGARTIFYRLDLVEAWFAEREVKGFDDPKYREIAATRKAKRAEARRTSPKIAKTQPIPQSYNWGDMRLRQLRSSAPASQTSQIGHFIRHSQSPSHSGPRTISGVAQSIVSTLCPKIGISPVRSSVFSKEVIARSMDRST